MFDFNLTASELSDFYADMADMAGDLIPTDEDMAAIAAYWGED